MNLCPDSITVRDRGGTARRKGTCPRCGKWGTLHTLAECERCHHRARNYRLCRLCGAAKSDGKAGFCPACEAAASASNQGYRCRPPRALREGLLREYAEKAGRGEELFL